MFIYMLKCEHSNEAIHEVNRTRASRNLLMAKDLRCQSEVNRHYQNDFRRIVCPIKHNSTDRELIRIELEIAIVTEVSLKTERCHPLEKAELTDFSPFMVAEVKKV